jgi:8-oxo-dGTP pyrophosphatase MutT (NUDIX family)
MGRPWKPSVTVAAVVEHDGRFLMVEEETSDGVRLNQPAGHLDPGETLADAAAREALEETAHTFRPTALLGVYVARSVPRDEPEGVTYVRFAFTGELGNREDGRALDDGILRTLWLTADEIRARSAEHRSPLVMQCVDDYLTGRTFPLDFVFTHASALAPARGETAIEGGRDQ